MRFIRKNGRVIPIRDDRGGSASQKQGAFEGKHKAQAALGAAVTAGSVAVAGHATKLMRSGQAVKAAKFAAHGNALIAGTAVAGGVASLVAGVQRQKRTGSTGEGFKETIGQDLSRIAGAAAAAGAIGLSMSPKGRGIIMKGLGKAKQASGKIADARKFRKATQVTATVVSTGLARRYK